MSLPRRADLHLHTSASDGTYEPEELVRLACELRFDAIAVTDHDSVASVEAAVDAGRRLGVQVIAGVELSTRFDDVEAHLVGLFIDPTNAGLTALIDRAVEERRTRLVRITERLAEEGIDVSADDILDEAAGGSVGRVHLAEALVRSGHTSSISESFVRFLAEGRPAYVPKWSPSPETCCRTIREAGGVAVFAHPGDFIDELRVKHFVTAGCRALEAYYPTYGRTLTETYVKLADRLDVGVSGGSDCHGARKKRAFFGTVSVPMTCVEDLERRRG